ncbi:uncharacterized protein N0V89_001017 [Didymosphaeria variabile]|uniref:Uncharacterized protein n=1 Tax=Didymosphaeria variabile TaxID=1932322 RepID=A0A9W9CG90_9PLEO|nr:uncharacterized protein N0V89_001017 [Didymosphaeria variabile]KAJ4360454.1 hypothetical protein N0V89_001017 [Didymosphaeria variabile]
MVISLQSLYLSSIQQAFCCGFIYNTFIHNIPPQEQRMMPSSDVTSLSQHLLEATRLNQILLKRIQELEVELAQVKQTGARHIRAAGAVYAQDTLKALHSAPSYIPVARQAGARHRRTETPQQLFLKDITDVKVYTTGIEPQDDRGLLHDFFEDIRKWAIHHTNDLDAREIAPCSSVKDIADMMGGKSDIQHLLSDRELRQDVVSALIIRDIVFHAIGEGSMLNSEHHNGEQCRQIVSGFAMLPHEDYPAKHRLCLRQEALYQGMYTEHHHHEWRSKKADERTKALLNALSSFLHMGIDADREHSLNELYVKGYRIGFRLRSKAVKWQVIFPVAGMNLDLKHMVNRTLNLVGDPMTTWKELVQNREKYCVRFAITPTMTKSDFATGKEVKEVVHSALVHVWWRNGFDLNKSRSFKHDRKS